MVYDVPNALLLGRLALYSGMTSRQVNWKIVNFAEIVLDVKTNSMINVEARKASPGLTTHPLCPSKK